jgi:bifunctional non-homologous end joining protein LigD
MTRTTDSEIPFTPPMECLPVASLPDSPGWVYKLKLDGFRGQGIRDIRGRPTASKGFPQVCAALKEALPLGTNFSGVNYRLSR